MFISSLSDENFMPYLWIILITGGRHFGEVLWSQHPITQSTAQLSATENWNARGDWIQLASRQSLADAQALAAGTDLANTFVFTADNGWYVVALGPYTPATVNHDLDLLLARNQIPVDSVVTGGRHFGALVWGRNPMPPVPMS